MQHVRCVRCCAGSAFPAKVVLQSLVDEAQEVRTGRPTVRDDMDPRVTHASFREHVDRNEVSPRSRRPPRLGRCPRDLEPVPCSVDGVVMLVDRRQDFSLRHRFPRGKTGLLGSNRSIAAYQSMGQDRIVQNAAKFRAMRIRSTSGVPIGHRACSIKDHGRRS
jgi:hypothetical protein